MSNSSSRRPQISIRTKTDGNGPPCSGWQTKVSIRPSEVLISVIDSIIGTLCLCALPSGSVGVQLDVFFGDDRRPQLAVFLDGLRQLLGRAADGPHVHLGERLPAVVGFEI